MLKPVVIIVCGLASIATSALAKLPPPTPEQQAAATLAAAKAAHAAKTDAYDLCMVQSRIADAYLKEQKAKGKDYTPAATPACVNPGPFVPPAPVATTATGQTPAGPTSNGTPAKK
jgi:hypothetical protein